MNHHCFWCVTDLPIDDLVSRLKVEFALGPGQLDAEDHWAWWYSDPDPSPSFSVYGTREPDPAEATRICISPLPTDISSYGERLCACLCTKVCFGFARQRSDAYMLEVERRFQPDDDPVTRAFAAAAGRRPLAALQTYLSAGGELYAFQADSNWSLLDAAIELENFPAIDLLLAAGFDVNRRNRGGGLPLLLALDVDIDAACQRLQRQPEVDEFPEPLLAARLLRAGADPTLRDPDGQNALEFAANRGHLRAVALLRQFTVT